MSQAKGKVVVAMSGGVDSSVAAALLKNDGYEVVGAFMRLGSPGESLADTACDPQARPSPRIGHQGCCSINDARDAQLVAAELGVPLYILNFKKDFGRIINYFVDEYNAGRTPNPCVRCNDWLKFGRLWQFARSIDARYVASGHYARVEGGQLLRGLDHAKDQSYVVFGTQRHHLSHMLLPIGAYHKAQVRRIAAELGLPVSSKPDSQEICFVPDQDYAALIERRAPQALAPGAIRDTAGHQVGRHAGHQRFTIGQRRGVGVALGHPIYVVEKDPAANTVTVGTRPDLARISLTADQTNWLIDPPLAAPVRCTVKIRYNSRPVPAAVRATGTDELTVRFDEPQYAVAPGQAVVCYDGQRVLGGGWIRSTQAA
jgi:tRNA-uridine 2-sulfurtransferase